MEAKAQSPVISETAEPSPNLSGFPLSKDYVKCTTTNRPCLSELKRIPSLKQGEKMTLGARMLYPAQSAISTPQSIKNPHDFVEILTKLAAGRHPKEVLSETMGPKNTHAGSYLTEADLIGYLARFAAESLWIYEDEIAPERRVMIMAPRKVDNKSGTVVINDDGWLRLVKATDVGNRKLAIEEDNFLNDDSTVGGEYDFPEPIELFYYPSVASKTIYHSEPSFSVEHTHAAYRIPESDIAHSDDSVEENNQAVSIPFEYAHGTAPCDYGIQITETEIKVVNTDNPQSTENTAFRSKRMEVDHTSNLQESQTIWPPMNGHDENEKIAADTFTVAASEETQKVMSKKEQREEKKRLMKKNGNNAEK